MRFRKIDVRIWNDEKVRSFTDDGKLAWVFLLTNPGMTSVGAMRGTLPGLAAELGWAPRRIERALASAIDHGMLEVNRAASYIGVRNFTRYNAPESPNVARAWATALRDLVPECDERRGLIERCRVNLAGPFLEAFDQGLREAFGEALRHPSRNQEQEQEQEQKAGAGVPPPTSPNPHVRDSVSTNGRPSRRRVDADWGRS